MTTAFARLGTVDPAALGPARLNLHWAAQLVGSAGRQLVATQADDSHTNLLWWPPRRGFVGRATPTGHRVALDVVRLRVNVLARDGSTVGVLDLPGHSLDEAFGWLSRELKSAGNDVGAGLSLPAYDLPEHAVASGGPFEAADTPALAELTRWYGAAAVVLEAVRRDHAGASEVRCWPHHFDIATLIQLDPAADDVESARSVGVGCSPGDGGYPQPYFYVTPWPKPADPRPPGLPGGAHWHREGWFGAVLTGDKLVAAGDAEAQHERLSTTLEAAIGGALRLLGPGGQT